MERDSCSWTYPDTHVVSIQRDPRAIALFDAEPLAVWPDEDESVIMHQHVVEPLPRRLCGLEGDVRESARERPERVVEVRDAAVDMRDEAVEVETRWKRGFLCAIRRGAMAGGHFAIGE
jgi:hypothetical protein